MRARDVRRGCTRSSGLVAPRPPGTGADTGQSAAQHERLRAGEHHRRASPSFPRLRQRGSACTPAIADGTYPYVFNNDKVDGSFGVTSPIYLDELTPWGQVFGRIPVPTRDIVTSFSSKSELALNLSTNGQDITFMGYQAPVAALDVSNSNTPGVIDPTNPVTSAYYREVADLGRDGRFDSFTLTNAYSGNNGRAAILNNAANVIYTAGNAGNGSNPQPNGVILGAGAQILSRSFVPEWFQTPGAPTPVGSFNVTQLGDKADKVGKDTNFRGLTISTTSSTSRRAAAATASTRCTSSTPPARRARNRRRAAAPGASSRPRRSLQPGAAPDRGRDPVQHVHPRGFPTTLAKTATGFPFGLWFANRPRCTSPTRATARPRSRHAPTPTPTPRRRRPPAAEVDVQPAASGSSPTRSSPG